VRGVWIIPDLTGDVIVAGRRHLGGIDGLSGFRAQTGRDTPGAPAAAAV
jgi:hypothetical protein